MSSTRPLLALLVGTALVSWLATGISPDARAQSTTQSAGRVPAAISPQGGGKPQSDAAARHDRLNAHPAAMAQPAPPPEAAGLAVSPAEAALVRHGEYMTQAADCMPCHTRPGGTPYAGGLILNTPFGRMASPNITQDKQTGLGRWTETDFWNVLHNGKGPHLGEYIYPTMTYTSYTKLTRDDVHAMWSYMRTIKPVDAPRLPISLPFPFNIRPSLLGWQIMFMDRGTYRPDPHQSAEWNRGAYLVEGAGHCGECHTPRNALGGMLDGRSLAGAVVDGFLAPNISSDTRFGIGEWSEDEITDFLKHGNTARTVVFGPMSEVVHDSMAYMTDGDLHAIAVYLKSTPPRHGTLIDPARDQRQSIARGSTLYAANCAQCHQADGRGVNDAIPNLAQNSVVIQRGSEDVIMPILVGLEGQGSYGAMPAFGGALSDRDIADVVNYVRTNWRNTTDASTTAATVAAIRADAPTGLGGSVEARRLGCGKIGDGTVPDTIATEDEVAIASWVAGGNAQNAILALAARAKRDNPSATPADVLATIVAAYCPVLANTPRIDAAEKRRRLADFAVQAGQQVALIYPQSTREVLVSAVVTPDMADTINQAAQSAHMTTQAWIATQLQKIAPKQ